MMPDVLVPMIPVLFALAIVVWLERKGPDGWF